MTVPVKPAFVQAGTNVNLATVSSMTPAITGVTAGNCLVLAISSSNTVAGRVAATVSDSAGGTWLRGPSIAGANGSVEIWYLLNAGVGTHTLTVTMNGTLFCGCEIDEFSGVIAVGPGLDTLGTNSGSSTTVTAPTITPSNVNELLYFATLSNQAQTVSPSAPYTARTGPTNSGFQFSGIAYVAPNNLISGYAPTWTCGSSLWVAAGIALKGAQPITGAPFNDPVAQASNAVLTAQARPDYLDWMIDDLAPQGTGVLSGCAVSPNTNADFKWQNAAGVVLLNWGPVTVSASTANTITAADATNPRRDLVYATPAGVATYLVGVASATPCPPPLPANCAPLGIIDVPANATVHDNGTSTSVAHTIDKRALIAYPPSARDGYGLPTVAYAETLDRRSASSLTVNGAGTGKITGVQIVLQAGLVIGHLAFLGGSTAAVTPTHWWFALLDLNGNLLAITADQTTGTWPANILKSLAIATTAQGAQSTFTTTYTGVYYLAHMMAAGTVNNFAGQVVSGAAMNLAPFLSAQMSSQSGLTTPLTFPATLAGQGTGLGVQYGYVGP